MRQRSLIFVVVLVVALLGGTVAAVAYDSSRDDLIASGVTVAGVDVGGMRADQARADRGPRAARPAQPPGGGDARQLALRAHAPARPACEADVDGMVDEALEASRSGNIVSRVARDITGGDEDAQVPPRVTYSRAAVEQLVERVVAQRRTARPRTPRSSSRRSTG